MPVTEPIQFDEAKRQQGLLAYAKRGWHVFPCYEINEQGNCACSKGPACGNPGKHPRTPSGFKNASTDPEQIREWLRRWPRANWAIACGASRLAVVDVDPRNNGDETLAALEKAYAPLPDTIRACTGGGGQHYLYAFPEGEDIQSSVLGLGIDLKATGGYIMVPPSNHVSGRSYLWDAGGHPRDLPQPAEAPQWILTLIGTKDAKQYEASGAVVDGFLGAAFEAAGWLGRSLGADKQAARCPWEDEHSTGSRFDSSTVLFGPTQGFKVGWFWCSHGHCQRARTLKDVLAQLPDGAKAKAREKLGLDALYNPEEEEAARQKTQSIQSLSEDWAKLLRRNAEGFITRDAGNAALLLANLEEWRGCLEYDSFADRMRWVRPVPDLHGLPAPKPGDELADHHVLYVHHWLAKLRGIAFTKQAIQDALELAAKANERHPLRDWLASLQWDRKPRAATWLTRYLGAPDDPYTHAVGRWWLISAVARIFSPGCQADHLVVLQGGQGAGKSTAARILGGEFFLANLPDITNKDAAAVLQGHWIVEIGELDAFRGAAGTRVKDWVTRTVDSFRPAYGRFTIRRSRSSVFIGTTNEEHFLLDATGARRFWPVTVSTLAREELQSDRAQIWAEAKHYYDAGEPWWPSEDLAPAIHAAQEERYVGDEWERRIEVWAKAREPFTIGDVLGGCLGLEPGKWERAAQTRVGNCLRRLGWTARQTREGEARVRRYYQVGAYPTSEPPPFVVEQTMQIRKEIGRE